jgi:hypothetical protein
MSRSTGGDHRGGELRGDRTVAKSNAGPAITISFASLLQIVL